MPALDRDAANKMLKRVSDIIEQEFGKENFTKIRGSFSEGRMRISLELKPEMTDAEKDELRQKEWNKRCEFFNLTPEDFGMQIRHAGNDYIVHGLKPPARRGGDPVEVKRIDNGKVYIASIDTVIKARPKDRVVPPALTVIDARKAAAAVPPIKLHTQPIPPKRPAP